VGSSLAGQARVVRIGHVNALSFPGYAGQPMLMTMKQWIVRILLLAAGRVFFIYTEDTVFKIPTAGDYNKEWELLGEVGAKVTDIIFDGDAYEGRDRIDRIQARLKELEAAYN